MEIPDRIDFDEKNGWWMLCSDDDHGYVVMPMLFNYRLAMTPLGSLFMSWSWCYPSDLDLIVNAVRRWDSRTVDEPEGWHKRVFAIRRAPDRDPLDVRNRDRCVHGRHDGECQMVECRKEG